MGSTGGPHRGEWVMFFFLMITKNPNNKIQDSLPISESPIQNISVLQNIVPGIKSRKISVGRRFFLKVVFEEDVHFSSKKKLTDNAA